jgi:hypothetical protein
MRSPKAYRPRSNAAEPSERFSEFVLTVAGDGGNTDNLARFHRHMEGINRNLTVVTRYGEVFDLKHG